mmetsp:Transcript_22840/g.36343  ORF Transcript_22840/g.36343 Transcript_22840/m.36343 type:complete len:96 (-) Transcript_22840:78-365(-)
MNDWTGPGRCACLREGVGKKVHQACAHTLARPCFYTTTAKQFLGDFGLITAAVAEHHSRTDGLATQAECHHEQQQFITAWPSPSFAHMPSCIPDH